MGESKKTHVPQSFKEKAKQALKANSLIHTVDHCLARASPAMNLTSASSPGVRLFIVPSPWFVFLKIQRSDIRPA